MQSTCDNKLNTESLSLINKEMIFEHALRLDEESHAKPVDLLKNWDLLRALVITKPGLTLDYIELLGK